MFLVLGCGFIRPVQKTDDLTRRFIINGGKDTATQSGFSLILSEKGGFIKRKIDLSCSSVTIPQSCVIFEKTVFLPDKNLSVGAGYGGDFSLMGGAVFNINGELLNEFPITYEKCRTFFPAERIFLLGDDMILIKTSSLIFVFDTKSGVCIYTSAAFIR